MNNIRRLWKNCPDACIFINSLKGRDRIERKYFEDLSNRKIGPGILLETIRKEVDRWVNDFSNAILSFREHCRKTSAKCSVYLEYIEKFPQSRKEKRYKRYTLWIKKTEKLNDGDILKLQREIRNRINDIFSIFLKHPNIEIKKTLHPNYLNYLKDIIKELKKIGFNDQEDSQNIALLSFYINSQNKKFNTFLITTDSGIYNNSESINKIKELRFIFPINIDDFYGKLPLYIIKNERMKRKKKGK